MKKVISILISLMLVLSVVGCSQNNSNEKVSDKQGQEVNTEINKQDKVEENTQSTQNKENGQEIEDTLLLKGKIVGYGGGSDVGDTNTILLDKKLSIHGKEVDRIWLEEKSITDLIPRKYFAYYFEESEALKEEFIEKIPIEVEIDSNSVNFVDFYTFGKVIKVVSLDGETNPRDKTKDEYPIEYYEDAFNSIWRACGSEEGFVPADVKECHLYKDSASDDIFRVAVDKILEAGLYINMLEGDYEIETEKRYSEEGVGTQNEQSTEDTLIIKGKIGYFLNGVRGGVSFIVLDEKMDIDGRQVDELYFDGDFFRNFIPRKYMTYYFEGGISLREESTGKIDIQVKIESNSLEYDDDYDMTFAKFIEVVSLDGEKNPRDKTGDEYPIEYYKDVVYNIWQSYGREEFVSGDIKEYHLYKDSSSDGIFRSAVDKILEAGFYINMVDGDCEIETEKR